MPNEQVATQDDFSDLGAVAVNNDDFSDIGAVEVPKTEFQLSTARPATFLQKINSFFRSPEQEQAKAMNVYALSKLTGLSLKETYDNYDFLRDSPKITGLPKPEAGLMDVVETAIPGAIIGGTVAAASTVGWPLAIGGTAMGLVTFSAIDNLIPTEKWIKDYEDRQGFEVRDEIKKGVEFVDFIGKSLLTMGVIGKSSQLAARFIERKVLEKNIPATQAVLSKIEEVTGEPSILPMEEVSKPLEPLATTSLASTTPKETTEPLPGIAQPPALEPPKVEAPVSSPSSESISKERGFIKSVKESEMVTPETKEAIAGLSEESTSYDVYSDKAAVEKAQDLVAKDPEGALTYVLNAKEFDKDVSTTGIELMRRYREMGDVNKEVSVAENLAEKGTRGGQFIQAYSLLDKLSPEGVLVFAQRQINKGLPEGAPRKIIDPEFADKLKLQAQVIQDTPYGYQKVLEINKLAEMIAEKKGRSVSDWLLELINVPRTLMAGMLDFSFGLRQGLFLMPSYAKEWGGAFSKQFGAFAKQKNYDALMDSIMKHPDFKLADESGVAFTDIRGDLGKLEERYMGINMAERIPLIGGGVRATSRAYTGMANKMRMDVFSKMIKDAEDLGLKPRENKPLLKEIATFVNAGTGRGGLQGNFQKGATLLNAFFFSPRLMSSRLTLLNPQYYVTRKPFVRKQAVKSLFSFMGLWATMLTMAKLSGAEVGTDPRSADFGKIKINDTRIDIGGGFAQYMRILGQQITGKYVSSVTGKEHTLGEGYKPMTRYDILLRQVESKEAPIFSFISDVLKQQDWQGNKISIPKEVADRFTPMVIQDMKDLAENDPELLPLGILTVFGAGVQTYEKKKNKIKF